MARNIYRKLGYTLAMGAEIGGLVGGCAWLGAYLDARYGSSPALTLCGLFFGIIAAGFRIWFYIKLLTKDD
jgi:hypothetical protein